MIMTVEKYYDDNLENYNLLNKIDPMTAKQVMQMMEEYHQTKLKLLGIANAVGRSEQLVCDRCKEQDKEEPTDPYCMECKIEIEQQAN